MRRDLKRLFKEYALFSSLRAVSHIARHGIEKEKCSSIFIAIWSLFLTGMVIATGASYCLIIQKFITWETAEMVKTRHRTFAFPSVTLCEIGLGNEKCSFQERLEIRCRFAKMSFSGNNNTCNHYFSIIGLKRAKFCQTFTVTEKMHAMELIWVSFKLYLKSSWDSHVHVDVHPDKGIPETDFQEQPDELSGFGVRMILHDWNSFPFTRTPEFLNLLINARNRVTITETRQFVRQSWPYSDCINTDSRVMLVENRNFAYTEEACHSISGEGHSGFCPTSCNRLKHSLSITYLGEAVQYKILKQKPHDAHRLTLDISRFNQAINEYFELPMMDAYSFLAKFGGMGGMFLGLTTVAIMEVVHLFIRICTLLGRDVITQHETINLNRNYSLNASECSVITYLSENTEYKEKKVSL